MIITIGREFGSGGRLIGRNLANLLEIPFYDKTLIHMAAKETGLSEEFISKAEQHRVSGFFYNSIFSSQTLSLSDQVFIAESNIIKELADKGSCVVVGRCADYVLREYENLLKVFIYAPIDERIKRAENVYNIQSKDIKSYIIRQDKLRASYYNYFTFNKWGQYKNYDLSVNSSFGIDCIAKSIKYLIENRE